jgi:DNA-binding transcriptional LysR family regulator
MVLLCCARCNTNSIYNNLSNLHQIKEPFLLFDNPVLVYHNKFTAPIFKMLDIREFHIVDNLNVMLQMIALGQGYTFIPKSSVFQLSQWNTPIIQVISLRDKLPKMKIQIIHAKAELFSAPIERITQKLLSYCSK